MERGRGGLVIAVASAVVGIIIGLVISRLSLSFVEVERTRSALS
ncbi:MAG TPA: hypothetical protein VLD55_04865 [Candidatus Sulfobium mesophilum]|nr:hypothetical protein [Candidatus Sulfobium mesophilum]